MAEVPFYVGQQIAVFAGWGDASRVIRGKVVALVPRIGCVWVRFDSEPDAHSHNGYREIETRALRRCLVSEPAKKAKR